MYFVNVAQISSVFFVLNWTGCCNNTLYTKQWTADNIITVIIISVSDAFLSSDAASWPSLEQSLWLQLQQTPTVHWWGNQTQYYGSKIYTTSILPSVFDPIRHHTSFLWYKSAIQCKIKIDYFVFWNALWPPNQNSVGSSPCDPLFGLITQIQCAPPTQCSYED